MAKMVAVLLAGVMALAVAPLAGSPAGAVPGQPRVATPFSLDLVEGTIQLRGSDEPRALEAPTSIAGTVDGGAGGTGAISGADLSTPPIRLELVALGLPVVVDATFSSAVPGTGTGSVDADGNLLFQTALTLDLHIDVSDGAIVTDCRSTPISLTLNSTVPYSPETKTVTLADPDFTVPPVQADGCNPAVAENINGMLAGSGHALEVTLENELPLPTPPECRTVSALGADPAGGSDLGDPVTLTATVAVDPEHAADPACDDAPAAPTGFVDFLSGTTVLSTVPLTDGAAELVTEDLPAGPQDIVVQYRGEAPFAKSSSDPLSYLVAASPGLVPELPATIQVAGPAAEFDVTVTNTGFGRPLTNARLDLHISRALGTGALDPPNLTLEAKDEAGDWQPVTLVDGGTRIVTAQVGATTGFPLTVGASEVVELRLGATTGTPPGPLAVTFTVNEVAPADGTVVGPVTESTLRTTLVEATRRPSVLAFRASNAIFRGPVDPHTVSQGHTVHVPNMTLGNAVNGVGPTGFIEVLIDGRQVPVTPSTASEDPGWVDRFPASGTMNFLYRVPRDLSPGPHEIRVRYLGDSLFAPTQAAATFHVIPAAGDVYECRYAAVASRRFNVTINAHVSLPAAAPGGVDVPLTHLSLEVLTDRSRLQNGLLSEVFSNATGPVPVSDPGGLTAVEIDLGAGRATALTTERLLGTDLPMSPIPATADINQSITFGGLSGTLELDGDVGQVHQIALNALVLRGTNPSSGLPLVVTCVPQAAPIDFGSVTQGGVDLAVEAGNPTREGDLVGLSATVAPDSENGFVEFRDGDTTIGFVPVAEGAAAMTTTALAEGTHSLTARYFGSMLASPYVSDPVELVVEEPLECPAQAQEGDAAVVRLVYLLLLGRCPATVDFTFWVDQLDGGLSPATFARRIAATPEALGRQVDEAYRLMLDRPSDLAGRQHWIPILRERGWFWLVAQLGASPEYWEQGGATVGGFVDQTYQRLLGRPADAAGRQHWIDRLEGGESRRVMLLTFARTTEAVEGLVERAYELFLDRVPTAEELAAGVSALRATGDRAALHASLIGSQEFFDRAQTFPNRPVT